jgi:hypothetical protein
MWKNPFKKVPPASTVALTPVFTLKERVLAFWTWFSEVADDFYATIDDKRCRDLEPVVSAKVDELLPGFGWVFGPGADGKGHSFTLTPEGVSYKRLPAYFWLSQAPHLEGWTFYASRQATTPISPDRSIQIDGLDFKAQEIWITPWVDGQEEKIDITVWHPLFDKIKESLRHTVTFLWLDEVLGEEGTSNWIGEIKLGDQRLADAMPLSELPELIDGLQKQHGWEKYPPHETFSGYRGKDPECGQLRRDVIAGTTCMMRLVYDYPLDENPLKEMGAEYHMIAIPADRFPQGRQVEVRGELEDAIADAFELEASGKVLGGAGGMEHFYIDLIFYDGMRSRQIVERALQQQGFGDVAKLHPFVKSAP